MRSFDVELTLLGEVLIRIRGGLRCLAHQSRGRWYTSGQNHWHWEKPKGLHVKWKEKSYWSLTIIRGTSAHPSYAMCFIIQHWFITGMIAFEIQYLHSSTDAFLAELGKKAPLTWQALPSRCNAIHLTISAIKVRKGAEWSRDCSSALRDSSRKVKGDQNEVACAAPSPKQLPVCLRLWLNLPPPLPSTSCWDSVTL